MNIALGTIPFGTTVGEKDSFALLDRFAEVGGTMIDTANNYTGPRAAPATRAS